MYRLEDIDHVKKNIHAIQETSLINFRTKYEPTISEYKEVRNHILEYIKINKKIIYGGYAQNKLIEVKDENDIFYKETDTPDIEFYSYDPVNDLVELCNFLYEKKMKYIEGKEGVHNGTYKIFVNFENYCDISYISKNIYTSMKFIEINNIRYAHPHFMYIDFYRIFTDPNSFSFKLDKSFNRYIKLYKYYPIKKHESTDIKIEKTSSEILLIIRKKIIHNSNYIIVGKYAYNYYINKINGNLLNVDYYEFITLDFNEEVKKILLKLNKYFNNKITTKEYTPFFEFFGRRIEFYLNNKLILKVYDNNHRCIVYHFSEKKKCYFGTNQLVLLFLFSNYNYEVINRNKIDETNNLIMIYNFILCKNKYLEIKNKTVLDKTPFEDFIINCNGISLNPLRESFLERQNKKKKGLRPMFRYEPSEKKTNISTFIFENTSGNLIINDKNLIIKKK